jgi:hypothetical protein
LIFFSHGAPNPKKSIELGANDKKGRYVRIQLLDDYYLSGMEMYWIVWQVFQGLD